VLELEKELLFELIEKASESSIDGNDEGTTIYLRINDAKNILSIINLLIKL
jgi:hypothetical protein